MYGWVRGGGGELGGDGLNGDGQRGGGWRKRKE